MGGITADRCKVPNAFWLAVERIGLRPPDVVRKARLPAAIHLTARHHLSTGEVFALFRAIEDLAELPGPGLRMIADTETAAHPPFSLAAFHARDFRDALGMRARFQCLSAPKKIDMAPDRKGCVITVDWLHADGPPPAIAVDMDFASFIVLGRRATGEHIVPTRVDLARPDPRTGVHEAFFGCRPQFNAARDALAFAARDLDRPFPGRNPELLDILWPALLTALGDQQADGIIRAEVKLAIKRGMAAGRPDLSDIARDLGTSERTLQRRITESGATFRELLIEARQELGKQLLRDPSADIDAIASLLGYRDTSSFYRAFREWEGMTPRRWRQLQVRPA